MATSKANATASFTLDSSASTFAVTQGSSASGSVTVAPENGFTSSVILTASGLPTGVTAAFGTNPTTGISVVTFTASSSATTGSSTVTITGISGSTTATTSFTLSVSTSGGSSISTTTYYTIANEASGLCVDDPSGATANGTTVQQYSCGSGNANQEWLFRSVGNGYYEVTAHASSTAAWNVIGARTTAETGIQLYANYGGMNEQFEPIQFPSGYVEFIDHNSILCLNFPSTSNGQQLQISTCNGLISEMFKLNQI